MATYKQLTSNIVNGVAKELAKHGLEYHNISEDYSSVTFAEAFDFLTENGYSIAVVKDGNKYYALCDRLPYFRSKTETEYWETTAYRAILYVCGALSEPSIDEFCQQYEPIEDIVGTIRTILEIAHDFINDDGFGMELGNLDNAHVSAYVVSRPKNIFLHSKNEKGEHRIDELSDIDDLKLLTRIYNIMHERVD